MYKVCCVVAAVALFVPLWMVAQPRQHSAEGMLAVMRDKSRPVLIFYPQRQGERPVAASLSKQRELFQGHEAELKERDVVVIFIPTPDEVPSTAEHQSVDPSASAGLRRQFQIDDRQFMVVLLGKDGGEKFRSHEPVTIEKLNAVIDAMPMRQQEVRDGHHSE